jgi:hypothetical protein
MIKSIFCSLAATLLLAVSGTAVADDIGIQVEFSDKEISLIRAYYQDHDGRKHSQKKAKGRKSLPPGIAKNLRRGKPLPPGIAKQVLPVGLLQMLPPPPHGHERIVIAGKILLVEIATQVIHDVLEDVILH